MLSLILFLLFLHPAHAAETEICRLVRSGIVITVEEYPESPGKMATLRAYEGTQMRTERSVHLVPTHVGMAFTSLAAPRIWLGMSMTGEGESFSSEQLNLADQCQKVGA